MSSPIVEDIHGAYEVPPVHKEESTKSKNLKNPVLRSDLREILQDRLLHQTE